MFSPLFLHSPVLEDAKANGLRRCGQSQPWSRINMIDKATPLTEATIQRAQSPLCGAPTTNLPTGRSFLRGAEQCGPLGLPAWGRNK